MKPLPGHEAERTRQLIEWVWIGATWFFIALMVVIPSAMWVGAACAIGLIVFEATIHGIAYWWFG